MPGFREGGRPGSDKPKRELSSANFLQKHKEEMIAQPERINELLQELPEKKKAEVIDHFLGNFYMRLPGGSKRHVEVKVAPALLVICRLPTNLQNNRP